GGDAALRHAASGQDASDRTRPALGQVLVVGGRTGAVGMTDDLNAAVRILVQVACDDVEVVLTLRANRCRVGGKQRRFRHHYGQMSVGVGVADVGVVQLVL